MDTILTFAKQLDKQLHILGCFALTMTLGYLFPSPPLSFAIAALIVLALGVAKEVYDKQHPDKHTADPMDLVADAVGIAAGSLVLLAPVLLIYVKGML